MDISSFMPAKIICKHNAVASNASVFAGFGKSCLIVTGHSSAVVSGALADVTAALEGVGVGYGIFDGIEPNPATETCRRAGEAARSVNAEFIVGIGGGSALDAAKAVAFFASNPGFSHTDIYDRAKGKSPLPVLLVGTTAGTGSEVTGVSVLTNSDTGIKKSISGADCYAAVSFCDWKYTASVSYETTVSTALDAFAHAAESYLSVNANDISSLYSERAVPLLWRALTGLVDGSVPDKKTREELYIASLYAGLAINVTGTLFPHTVGYVLTENYGIPHGRACTAFMPLLAEICRRETPDRLDKLLKMCCTGFEGFTDTVRRLTDVKVDIAVSSAEETALRWKNGVKNFERTPGNFDYRDAARALAHIGW